MNSAKLNELTEAIWRVETQDFGGYSHRDALAIAKRLLELGYRKPREVTTAEQLDALPVGSVVLDGGVKPIMKEADGLWYFGTMPLMTGLVTACNPKGLTILFEPEGER